LNGQQPDPGSSRSQTATGAATASPGGAGSSAAGSGVRDPAASSLLRDPAAASSARTTVLRPTRLRGLLMFFAVLGPGIITASVDNDAGGITTLSVAGAHYGYALLWTVIPMMIALIVVQEMCARMGAVTGKGLADLIRESFGVRTTFYLMLGVLVANLSVAVSEFAGIAAAGELFGAPKYVVVPAAAAFVLGLTMWADHRTIERVFLIFSAFYFAYVISGFLARPDWSQVGQAFVRPHFRLELPFIALIIGLIGTMITPWMQFYLQASVVEKGVRPAQYRYCRIDVIVGCVVTHVIAFFVILTCGATIFAHRGPTQIHNATQAAVALAPLAGNYASALFGAGFFSAALFGACILPLSTAYSVCEAFGWESGVSHKLRQAPQFYGLLVAVTVASAALILVPGLPLIRIMLVAQVINGIILPFLLVAMLKLANRRDLMGDQVNGPVYNVLAWATVVVLILLSLALLLLTIVE
jgi:NRAMP (natural resistance-associated macrophage protein)-like metal ion transporter